MDSSSMTLCPKCGYHRTCNSFVKSSKNCSVCRFEKRSRSDSRKVYYNSFSITCCSCGKTKKCYNNFHYNYPFVAGKCNECVKKDNQRYCGRCCELKTINEFYRTRQVCRECKNYIARSNKQLQIFSDFTTI